MSQDLDELFDDALHFLNNENLAAAKECLAKMKAIGPNDAKTFEIEGDCAKEERDYDQAIQSYQNLLKDEDDYNVGRGHLSLGYLYLEQNERSAALKSLMQAAPLLENPDSPYDHLQAMATIAELQYELGTFEISAQTFQSILEQYEELELDDECSLIYLGCARQMADSLRCIGRLDDAQTQYQLVADITEELEVMDEYANAIDGIGVVHQLRGDFQEAKKYHLRSLEINEDLDDSYGIVANLANLARVHLHLEDWAAARKYASRLLQIETEQESVEGAGFAKLLLAECDIGTKNYAEADQTLQSLLKLFSRTGEADTYVNVISVIGLLRRLQGNIAEAERYQNETLKISLEMNNRDFLLSVYDELAEIRTAQKRYSEARDYWNKALEIAEELKSAKMLKTITKRLAEIAKL